MIKLDYGVIPTLLISSVLCHVIALSMNFRVNGMKYLIEKTDQMKSEIDTFRIILTKLIVSQILGTNYVDKDLR